MLAAAKPWTYWMAIPLLVSSVLALAGVAGVYLNKVVEPRIRREQALAAAEMSARLSGRDTRQLVRGQERQRDLALTAASSEAIRGQS